MTQHFPRDKGTFLLAFVAGLAINGTFAALFNHFVPFSLFPLLALALSAWGMHQRYLHHPMPQGMPLLTAAFFLLGVLFYSALVRVQYPQIGSNFIPTILMVALIFWIIFRLRARRKRSES